MKRGLYVAGLTLSLVVFGGFALGAVWARIKYGHLNSKGLVILIANAYVCWMVVGELRRQFRSGQH